MRLFVIGPAVAVGSLFLALEPLELSTEYRTGTTIRTEAESISGVEVADLTATLNGQELPRQALAGLESSLNETTTNTTTFVDSFLAVTDGKPERLERTFETVQKVHQKRGEETEETGVLEDRTLVITQDEDGAVTAEVTDDGDELEEDYLEEHRLIFLADYLLPADEVEVGETWTLDEDSAKRVVGLGAGPKVFASDQPDSDAMGEVLDRAGEVSMEVTFEGIEERDDVRCAHLTFETSITAKLDDLPTSFRSGMGDSDEVSGSVELDITVEGEAWLALEEKRPVELTEELSGTLLVGMNIKGGPEGQTREIEIKIDATLSGTNRQRWILEE